MGKFAYKWGVAFALLLTGCAAHRKNLGSPGVVHYPPECIHDIKKTAKTFCDRDAQGELHCQQAEVTLFAGCAQLSVVQNEKEKQ
jgi:hypothetical protein